MRRISVFGVTGSIGQNTADILTRHASEFDVIAVTGGENIDLLITTAKNLKAQIAVTANATHLDALTQGLQGTGITARAGRDALIEAAQIPVDWAMSAIVGFAGLEISLAIAQNSKTLALANKESLVCGGQLLNETCAQSGCRLLPVDSEHSAIFQALGNEPIAQVSRVLLTASGGPFLNTPLAELQNVTAAQAANHPKWSMGLRISIDSASMFNKAMEIIETKELFQIGGDRIEVLVHPQSIVHSMVEFVDGSTLAQLSPPDMRGAIGYALHYPERRDAGADKLDIQSLANLSFTPPDRAKFPAIDLAYNVLARGGLAGAVFNAAKEQALDLFLDGSIGFLDMAQCVDATLKAMDILGDQDADCMDKIAKADTWSRRFTHKHATTGL